MTLPLRSVAWDNLGKYKRIPNASMFGIIEGHRLEVPFSSYEWAILLCENMSGVAKSVIHHDAFVKRNASYQ